MISSPVRVLFVEIAFEFRKESYKLVLVIWTLHQTVDMVTIGLNGAYYGHLHEAPAMGAEVRPAFLHPASIIGVRVIESGLVDED